MLIWGNSPEGNASEIMLKSKDWLTGGQSKPQGEIHLQKTK